MIETIKVAIISSFLLSFGGDGLSRQELRCMADNLYYEARGEPLEGILWIGLVTYNRMQKRKTSACKIIYESRNGKPQFSWITSKPKKAIDRQDYEMAVSIASLILSGDAYDVTEGATHYTARKDRWFKKAVKTGKIEYIETIGKHRFYRELD